MKMLLVCNEFPYPLINGVRIKLYNIIKLMSEENEILLLILTENKNEIKKEYEIQINKYCKKIMMFTTENRSVAKIIFHSILHGKIYFLERYYSSIFKIELEGIFKKFNPDVIHFDTIVMSQYGINSKLKVAKVVSPADCFTLSQKNELSWNMHKSLYRRIYTYIKMKFCEKYESSIYLKYNICHLVSKIDANYLKMLNPLIKTIVIPNGVDINYFKLLKKRNSNAYKKIIFVAKFGHGNTRYLEDFLVNIWSVVKDQVSDAQLIIVGDNPPLEIQKIASVMSGIVFKGYIEDIRNCYLECMIAVVPIRKNCGILNKALESMAMEMAVAGFKESFSGIPEAKNYYNCVFSENNEGLILGIIDLLENPLKAIKIGKMARKLVENNYMWEKRKKLFIKMYQDAIYDYDKNKN